MIFWRTSVRRNRRLWSSLILFGSLGFLHSTPLIGGEIKAQEQPNVLDLDTGLTYLGIEHPFLKYPKPPFPDQLKREVSATSNMTFNAVVTLTIDHGKIVATPSGGNLALAKYLAWAVQKYWVANPALSGTFTLPIKFQNSDAGHSPFSLHR